MIFFIVRLIIGFIRYRENKIKCGVRIPFFSLVNPFRSEILFWCIVGFETIIELNIF